MSQTYTGEEDTRKGVKADDVEDASAVEDTSATPTTTTPGTCLDVYWDDIEVWFPCIVKSERVEEDGTTISLCAYDDGIDE